MNAVKRDVFAAVKEQQPGSFYRKAMYVFPKMPLSGVPVYRAFTDYSYILDILPRYE